MLELLTKGKRGGTGFSVKDDKLQFGHIDITVALKVLLFRPALLTSPGSSLEIQVWGIG